MKFLIILSVTFFTTVASAGQDCSIHMGKFEYSKWGKRNLTDDGLQSAMNMIEDKGYRVVEDTETAQYDIEIAEVQTRKTKSIFYTLDMGGCVKSRSKMEIKLINNYEKERVFLNGSLVYQNRTEFQASGKEYVDLKDCLVSGGSFADAEVQVRSMLTAIKKLPRCKSI